MKKLLICLLGLVIGVVIGVVSSFVAFNIFPNLFLLNRSVLDDADADDKTNSIFGSVDKVVVGDGEVVYSNDDKNGIGLIVPPATDKEDKTATVEVTPERLKGLWTNVHRDGDYLKRSSYDFYDGNSVTVYGSEYLHSANVPELFVGQSYGWHPAPMGFPCSYGTYTIDGNRVTLTLRDEFSEPTDPSYEMVLEIREITDEYIELAVDNGYDPVFENRRYVTDSYTYGDDYIVEICNRLGVNTEP